MVASNFPPVIGGIQTYAYRLARELARSCQLLVVAPESEGARAFDRHNRDLEIVRLRGWGDDLALSGVVPLARLLRRRDFDAAFATHWAPGFALAQAARLAGRRLPLFVAAHR